MNGRDEGKQVFREIFYKLVERFLDGWVTKGLENDAIYISVVRVLQDVMVMILICEGLHVFDNEPYGSWWCLRHRNSHDTHLRS